MEIRVYNYTPQEAIDVRINVFVDEQGFVDEFDETDKTAVHFVMFDDEGKAVATCRIFEKPDSRDYILGRLAVLKEYRGKGLGSKLIAAAEEYALQSGAEHMNLHAQLRATEFYGRNGYTEYGAIEYEEDCPHIWMKRKL